jgi:hypothetical protein
MRHAQLLACNLDGGGQARVRAFLLMGSRKPRTTKLHVLLTYRDNIHSLPIGTSTLIPISSVVLSLI